jgi:hypothetical protein
MHPKEQEVMNKSIIPPHNCWSNHTDEYIKKYGVCPIFLVLLEHLCRNNKYNCKLLIKHPPCF